MLKDKAAITTRKEGRETEAQENISAFVWPRRREFLLLEETSCRWCSVPKCHVHLGCAALPLVGSFPFASLPLLPQPELREVKMFSIIMVLQTDPHLPKGNSLICTKTRGDAWTARLPHHPAHQLGFSNPSLYVLQQCFPTFSRSYKKKQRNLTAGCPRHPWLMEESLLND